MLKVLSATFLVAIAAVPSAGAKPAPPPGLVWAPGVEISYTETVRDGAGRIVSTIVQDGIRPGEPFGSAVTAGSSRADATQLDAPVRTTASRRACCSSTGSDTVELTVTKRTVLGYVAWRYRQVKRWSWSYPTITSVTVGSGFYDVDGQQTVNYDSSGYGWYYGWAGSPFGGHYSYRQGSISNCIFRYGCLSTSYPWAAIWVNGNGAWTGNAGGA